MPLDHQARAKILRAAKTKTWRDRTVTPKLFDCSTFVCRVAMEALGYASDLLAADAEWLLDHLFEVAAPAPGDVVGYGRAANAAEEAMGRAVVWHVMIYLGNGEVIGADNIAGKVVIRPIEYEAALGDRQWRFIDPPPFRMLQLRTAPATRT